MPLSQDDLELYFQRLFPASKFVQWLGYGSPEYFARREFSFTLAGDIYLRFRSFSDASELQKDLTRKKPEKIDIGGVYNVPPKAKDSSPVFHALEKELVFDVDISDYDDVRACCQDKGICDKCWPLMACAAQVLARFLKDDFGYQHLLFVFSGRRGLHCWVCDRAARTLSDEARCAIIGYLNVYEGGEAQRLNIESQLRRGGLHPSLEDVYQTIIQPTFNAMFLSEENNRENCITEEKVAKTVYSMIARQLKPFGTEESEKLLKALNVNKPAVERWKAVQKFCDGQKASWVPRYVEFCCLYPRLDINVSKHCNHLLKAPFVVHPGTGNICLPIPIEEIEEFKPDQNLKLEDVVLAYSKDEFPLEPHLDAFQRFVDGCLLDAQSGAMDVDSLLPRTTPEE